MAECPTCGRTDFKSDRGMRMHHAKVHDESLSKVNKSCEYCGDDVVVWRKYAEKHDHHFCSDECQSRWRSEKIRGENHPNHTGKIEVKCEWCGDKVKIYPYRKDSFRFCSQECMMKHRTDAGTEILECEWCGTEFRKNNTDIERKNHHFCSKKCFGAYRSANFSGQNSPKWKGGASKYAAVRELLIDEPWDDFAEKHRADECYMCASTDNLHLHHIIPILSGGVNTPDLLMTLCASCHRKIEIWTQKQFKTVLVEP